MSDLDDAWELINQQKLNMVFIAGPYFGDGRRETIEANIREAEEYAVALANLGIGFFCPHLHTQHFGDKAEAGEPFYHALDFMLLTRVADAVLFTPRWMASAGARREQAWTKWRKMPEFYSTSSEDLSEIVAWDAAHQPYDRLELEKWAADASVRFFDFGVYFDTMYPGVGLSENDRNCEDGLRMSIPTGLRHLPSR